MSYKIRAALVGLGSLLDLDGRATKARAAALGGAHHPFFDQCEHGVQFLDECESCPDGWQPQGEWPAA